MSHPHKFDGFCRDMDKLIDTFEIAGGIAKLLMAIKADIDEASRIYSLYGLKRIYDKPEEVRAKGIADQSELLQKLKNISDNCETKVECAIGAQMIAELMCAFRMHATMVQEIWDAVGAYHQGIISDKNMKSLRDLFEFDDGA